MAFRNSFAGHQHVADQCGCPTSYFDKPRRLWRSSIHTDQQDTESEAWEKLHTLIDHTAETGSAQFAPGPELGPDLWRQIVTLPPTIGTLNQVRVLNLYGSNLRSLPPQIGQMTSLEIFSPYTSYRLHWFPYEMVHCSSLNDSTVSTRALYGNHKYRPTFPQLPQKLPLGAIPDRCSVCRQPAAELQQWWITLRIATDALPLLTHVCSDRCLSNTGTPPEGYVKSPHQGGTELAQPD